MLEYVPHVGAQAQALKEASRTPFRAAVLPQRGGGLHQVLGETGHLIGGDLLVLTYIRQYFEYGTISPDIGPDQYFDFLYLYVVHGAPSSTSPAGFKRRYNL